MTPNLQKKILAVLSFKKTTKQKDYMMTTTQSAMSATKQKTSREQKAKARQRTSYKDAAESERREFLNDGALLVSRAPASCLTRDVNRGQFRWVLSTLLSRTFQERKLHRNGRSYGGMLRET
jgi:hypothetical protein